MKISLNLLTGEQINYKMEKDSITIGRSPKCDLVISHEAMSRVHCQLEIKDGEIFITDLGSINGVYINGEKIPSNSTVPFQTYLHLAFGAVTAAQVELDEGTKIGVPSKIEALSNSKAPIIEDIRKQGQTKTLKVSGNARPSELVKKNSKNSTAPKKYKLAINILGYLLILLGVYLGFYYDEEGANDSAQQASPPPAKVIENKDHF